MRGQIRLADLCVPRGRRLSTKRAKIILRGGGGSGG